MRPGKAERLSWSKFRQLHPGMNLSPSAEKMIYGQRLWNE
tara:strand:- start:88 stop:207 length:120 start_codon:yes stop_codon:yes gene_type:complete